MLWTEVKIRNARPLPGKRVELPDGHGLILRVSPDGRKSWSVSYRVAGGGELIKSSKGTELARSGDLLWAIGQRSQWQRPEQRLSECGPKRSAVLGPGRHQISGPRR